MPFLFLLGYIPCAICAWHCLKTGKPTFWLSVLVIAPGLGAAIYFLLVWSPELAQGKTARKAFRVVDNAVAPNRDYDAARAMVEDTPSVANRKLLADICLDTGRFDEAATLYAATLHGPHADDPALLMGHARALVEAGRAEEAMASLSAMRALGDQAITPAHALVFARAFEATGDLVEADKAYAWASSRVAGLEGMARYIAFLAARGRTAEAETGFAEVEKRLSKIHPEFRADARRWRDFAALALGKT
jgi:hypothetical protein